MKLGKIFRNISNVTEAASAFKTRLKTRA